jgi:GTP-binding protein
MRIQSVEFITSAARPSDFPPDGFPEIALVGRSNVGKSSLLNSLAGKKGLARVSGTPGKTRLVNFFRLTWADPKSGPVVLVDLPGYGYARVPKALRNQWAGLVEGFLLGRKTLRGVVVLIDPRHEPGIPDRRLHEWIRPTGLPLLWVATKSDQVPSSRRAAALAGLREGLGLPGGEPVLFFSSKTGEGRDRLLSQIHGIAGRRR